MQLVNHVLLGFRRLRDRDYYAKDPLIARALGVRKIPDVSTMTRTLAHASATEVSRMAELVRDLTLERLEAERLARVTVDFDGSVLSTKGHAEGTAIGLHPKCKGARSVISQVGMFLDRLHRAGNVHDSNGSSDRADASHIPNASAHYELETLGTLAHLLIRQAGRLTRPPGALHLTTAASGIARREFERSTKRWPLDRICCLPRDEVSRWSGAAPMIAGGGAQRG